MRIEIPEFCLVALIGGTSSGKSTFAAKHFKSTEVLSSDFFRGMISDDENNQEISKSAFQALYYVAAKRLEALRLTVIDATNVESQARKSIIDLAKEQNCHAVAIVLNMPETLCLQRNALRPERRLPDRIIQRHCSELRRSLKHLKKEGFRYVFTLDSPEEAMAAQVVRVPLWTDKREEPGPFDIIGDVHGCFDELSSLLERLGYTRGKDGIPTHPLERRAIFLGDLCDRGPKNVLVLRLVMAMVKKGSALCVPGNHDIKLLRYLRGQKFQLTHGLQNTVDELECETEEFKGEVARFLDSLISHYVFDGGNLAVAHAGIKEEFQLRSSIRVRDFCIYGETTGERDEFGLPVRLNWSESYRGKALVVFGHIPQMEPVILNNTYCIDTGCAFGGKLTALRYPEKELVSVPAARCYYEPIRPLSRGAKPLDDMLSIEDVSGPLRIETRLMSAINIKKENSQLALETMSRFAVDPHWLIYLPPTMSPCETATEPEYLEYPTEAFSYYRNKGVKQVICEKKHMGSRVVIILCRNEEVARQRFSASEGSLGILYTRSGRRFFDDPEQETAILERLNERLNERGFWDDFKTDWVALDAELLPWSAKAGQLIEQQYAPVGCAGRASLGKIQEALREAANRSPAQDAVPESAQMPPTSSNQNTDIDSLLSAYRSRLSCVEAYVDAYGEYCWPVKGIEDLKIAPFHILASRGKVHSDEDHLWHMEKIRRYIADLPEEKAKTDGLFAATDYLAVDPDSEESVKQAIDWWLVLTQAGGEGMVVKPLSFVAKKGTELLQPAVKCRGREYLRIIYGPEYTLPEHLERLKQRSLSKKRRSALREFALGLEGLERFVANEPLYRVHSCVFGILACESEPTDPRL